MGKVLQKNEFFFNKGPNEGNIKITIHCTK